MEFDDYQWLASRTSNVYQSSTERLTNGALGLAGETGEVVELIKKHRYHGKEMVLDDVAKELGDVLWYLAEVASVLGIKLSEVADANIRKLRLRYPDGFANGGGIRDSETGND